MTDNGIVRLGFIGCGTIMKHAHLPASLRIRDVEIVGFYDIDRVAAQGALARLQEELAALARKELMNEAQAARLSEQAKVFDDVNDLLTVADCVDICTPVKWHTTYAAMALNRGVNVMSEKTYGPFPFSLPNMLSMLQAMARHCISLMMITCSFLVIRCSRILLKVELLEISKLAGLQEALMDLKPEVGSGMRTSAEEGAFWITYTCCYLFVVSPWLR